MMNLVLKMMNLYVSSSMLAPFYSILSPLFLDFSRFPFSLQTCTLYGSDLATELWDFARFSLRVSGEQHEKPALGGSPLRVRHLVSMILHHFLVWHSSFWVHFGWIWSVSCMRLIILGPFWAESRLFFVWHSSFWDHFGLNPVCFLYETHHFGSMLGWISSVFDAGWAPPWV